MKNFVDCSNLSRFLGFYSQELAATKITVVCIDVGRPAVGEPGLFDWAKSDFESVDDLARDVVLDRKDIGQIAVVAVSP